MEVLQVMFKIFGPLENLILNEISLKLLKVYKPIKRSFWEHQLLTFFKKNCSIFNQKMNFKMNLNVCNEFSVFCYKLLFKLVFFVEYRIK